MDAPGVMETVSNMSTSEEVVAEMRSAINQVRTLLGLPAFVVALDNDSFFDGEEAVGSERAAAVRARFRRFFSLKEYLAPSAVLPVRSNFF